MDYKRFRFRAEVDFLKISIQLRDVSTFPALQRFALSLLGYTPHVEPIEPGPSGASCCFRLTFQSPRRWREVDTVLRRMDERFPFAQAPSVDSVEIALDAYSDAHDSDELADLTAHMYWGCQRPVSANRRLYREAAEKCHAVPERERLKRKLLDGWQIGIGNTTDALYQHGYVKTTDKQQALAINQHRARFEVRVQGDALAVRDWRNWDAIDGRIVCRKFLSNAGLIPQEFTSNSPENVAKLLSFRRLDEAALSLADPVARVIMDAHSQAGERRVRNRRGGGTRVYSRYTEADSEMNARARDALRKLWARWCAGQSHTPKESACGISGAGATLSDCFSEKANGRSSNYLNNTNNNHNNTNHP